MKSAILTSDSNKNLKILIELAERLGVKTKMLTEDQLLLMEIKPFWEDLRKMYWIFFRKK